MDPHTHLVWAGDRADEFEMRLQKSYMEIMAAGEGIAATLKATRAASPERLLEETRQRADRVPLWHNHAGSQNRLRVGPGD